MPKTLASYLPRELRLQCDPGVTRAADAPPVAAVRPVTETYFGTPVVDRYRDFEDLEDPHVQGFMKDQATYTRSVLDALPGRGALPMTSTHDRIPSSDAVAAINRRRRPSRARIPRRASR